MGLMAKLSHAHKLAVRTAPVIDQRVRQLLLCLQSEGWRFKSGETTKRTKVGIEALIGAVLLDFLAKPEDAQLEILRARLPEFEAMLTGRFAPGEMRVGFTTPGAPAAAPQIEHVPEPGDLGNRVALPQPSPKKAAKRRSG